MDQTVIQWKKIIVSAESDLVNITAISGIKGAKEAPTVLSTGHFKGGAGMMHP